MNVLIVGGGIAGLTLAAFLRRRGAQVQIVEQAPHWAPVGFSIEIWNNGRRVLQELGVEDAFDKAGWIVSAVTFVNGKGTILKRYDFSNFEQLYAPVSRQLLREDLHRILREAAREVPIRFGITVTALTESGSGVDVVFSDGTADVFDVVVGADGVHSRVRELQFGPHLSRSSGWHGWYFWFDAADYALPEGIFEMWEPGEFFGAFPHGENKTSGYLAMPWREGEADKPETRLQRIREHFTDLQWIVPQIVATLKDPQQLLGGDIMTVRMPTWHSGRVVLIGDAAHAMEPFSGEGASMAMEDALVLAEELSQVETLHPMLAFERYCARREERVTRARRQTRQIWYWSKVHNPALRVLRDLALKIVPIEYFVRDYSHLLHDPM